MNEYVDLGCACATARRAARALTQMYDAHLRDGGMESAQFGLLSLVEAREGASQAVLARVLSLDKTTISRNLSLLEKQGWIEPAQSRDGRKRGFTLTSPGRKKMAKAKLDWRRAQDQLRESLSEREWTAMWTVMRSVTLAAESDRDRRN